MSICNTFLTSLCIKSMFSKIQSSIIFGHIGDCQAMKISSIPLPQTSFMPAFLDPQPSIYASFPRSPAFLDPQPAPIKPNIKRRFAFEVAACPAVDSCLTTGASG